MECTETGVSSVVHAIKGADGKIREYRCTRGHVMYAPPEREKEQSR